MSHLPKRQRTSVGTDCMHAAETCFAEFAQREFSDIRRHVPTIIKHVNSCIEHWGFSNNEYMPRWSRQMSENALFGKWPYYEQSDYWQGQDIREIGMDSIGGTSMISEPDAIVMNPEWVQRLREGLPKTLRLTWVQNSAYDNEICFPIGLNDQFVIRESVELEPEKFVQRQRDFVIQSTRGAWTFKAIVGMEENEYPSNIDVNLIVANSAYGDSDSYPSYHMYLRDGGEDPLQPLEESMRMIKGFLHTVISLQGDGIQQPRVKLRLKRFDYRPDMHVSWSLFGGTRNLFREPEYHNRREKCLKKKREFMRMLTDELMGEGLIYST